MNRFRSTLSGHTSTTNSRGPTLRAVVTAVAVALVVSVAMPAMEPAPAHATTAVRLRTRALDTRPNPAVNLRGSGWGHSVGMSQYGAYAMAQAGYGFRAILRHYYRGIAIQDQRMPSRIRVGLAYRDATRSAVDVTAVRNTVPWIVCGSTCGRAVRIQNEGTTWRAIRLADNRWRLKRGSKTMWTGGAGKRLVANFNPRNTRNAMIRSLNPNTYAGARYRYGRLELRAAPNADRRIWAVLDIKGVQRYLRGLGEVPNSWGVKGMASLKAQAVAARTYAVRNHRDGNGMRSSCACSLVATPADQVYSGYEKEVQLYAGLWRKAVGATGGLVATYGGTLIETFYSSSHGGRSEDIDDSYAFGATTATYPYLQSVSDRWSLDPRAGNPLASWTRRVSNGSIARFAGLRRVRAVRFSGRTEGGSPKTLVAYGVGADGRWRTSRRSGAKGIVGIDLKARYSFPERGLSTLPSQQIKRIGFAPFTDDDGKRNEYAHVYAYRANLIDPSSSRKFGRRAPVTRARLAKALYGLISIPRATRDYFDDDDGHRYEGAINAVREAGIMGGSGPRTFAPRDRITRVRLALILRRALRYSRLEGDLFDDVNGRAEASVNRIVRKGIMRRCGSRRFCPDRVVRRTELAVTLLRTVSRYR